MMLAKLSIASASNSLLQPSARSCGAISAQPSGESFIRGRVRARGPCLQVMSRSVLHQGETTKAIKRSLRAAKAAAASGIEVERVEYLKLPDGSTRITVYPKRIGDSGVAEMTPDSELEFWRRGKKDAG
jgi:hypothetical protein